jgi:hypothetical protein
MAFSEAQAVAVALHLVFNERVVLCTPMRV